VVGADVIQLQVMPAGDTAGDEDLAEAAAALQDELAELDVEAVLPATAGPAPPGSKGIELLALGGLLVKLGRSTHALREVVDAIRQWVGRTGASVRMAIDGDVLEIKGASSADVKQLIDVWVQRHGDG